MANDVGKLSRIGGWVSVVCAIHCMVSPVILGLIPIFHAESPVAEAFEKVLIGVSILVGVAAVATGYREHRRGSVVTVLVLSLLFLGAGLLTSSERLEPPLIVAGAMLMAATQFLNLRYHRNCCRRHEAEMSRSELSSIASRV